MSWRQLPKKVRKDLGLWSGIPRNEMDDRERKNLALLFTSDAFDAWNCPRCGNRVRRANQLAADKVFPGTQDETSEPLGNLCYDCEATIRTEMSDAPNETVERELMKWIDRPVEHLNPKADV